MLLLWNIKDGLNSFTIGILVSFDNQTFEQCCDSTTKVLRYQKSANITNQEDDSIGNQMRKQDFGSF